MKGYRSKTGLLLIMAVTSLSIAGCLSGGSESSDTPAPNPPTGQNTPPTIAGNPPPAVMVGDNYTFTPTASDADGDSLTFSVQNRPSWTSFDSTTGTLSGMATLGSEGSYANIVISVSDGADSSSLPQFAVEVGQSALGTATLTWTPPTQNADGSALNDLSGYRIYYGTQPTSFPNQIAVDNPGLSSYMVNNLVPNTYYFTTTSINSQGIESDFSNVASKTVN